MRRLAGWLGRTLWSLVDSAAAGRGRAFTCISSGAVLSCSPGIARACRRSSRPPTSTEGRITNLAQYRERERELLEQVRMETGPVLDQDGYLPLNRFAPGSLSDPNVWQYNWNRTFILEPRGTPVGGVLLLHGLTDSPYSLRSVGLALVARGYRVVGLRLPGHGTAPSGLLTFEVEDLEAATQLAMRDLRQSLGAGRPLFMIGYSNGAALAVSYTLAARSDSALPRPAGLVLISPAIGITRLAALGRIRTGLSELQGFGRAAWQVVETEVDPYKYQSFSWNAAGETKRLTSGVATRIAATSHARGRCATCRPSWRSSRRWTRRCRRRR